jgi:predicted MPP superfamily phosphohydrolase
LLQLSDLHLQSVDSVLVRAAEKINALKPDILFLTGDSVDRRAKLHLLDEFLGLIKDEIPKFAVLGNWEYWGKVDLARLNRIYADHNCRLLVNACEIAEVRRKKILVTGIDDFVGGDANIKTALKNYQDNDYHIILNHCPEYRDLMVDQIRPLPQIDAVLAGHTHGGQINILGYIPVMPPGSGRYIKGWYAQAPAPMYVSRGIGNSVAPLRFNSRPEITTFHVNV